MKTKSKSTTAWVATHPGTILGYELKERGISQKTFAEMIGMQASHLNELIKGKRPMTKAIAEKIEQAIDLPSSSLMNMQALYEYDKKVIEHRGIEELESQNILNNYNEIFDIKTLFKRIGTDCTSAVQKVQYITNILHLPQPAELKLKTSGMFKKSAKTGLNPRMLMTWKILAEHKSKVIQPDGEFNPNHREEVVKELSRLLHANMNIETVAQQLLSREGIVLCVEPKVDMASIDGYSYIYNGVPYIILTKRYNRIDNFAFALMHELGHIYLHYQEEMKDFDLSIADYDNESREEKQANAFASNALIPDSEWKDAPSVRLTPTIIQRKYSKWAEDKGYNKWIVLGRIAYETGMYRFKSDDSRKIQ